MLSKKNSEEEQKQWLTKMFEMMTYFKLDGSLGQPFRLCHHYLYVEKDCDPKFIRTIPDGYLIHFIERYPYNHNVFSILLSEIFRRNHEKTEKEIEEAVAKELVCHSCS